MPHSPTTRFPNAKYIKAALDLRRALEAGASWSGLERNYAYLNLGDTRFSNISAVSGLNFIDDGRALALADWDHDGDLDLWLSNRTGPRLRLMRNDTPNENHYLAVRLVGQTCNRDAIGARVEVHVEGDSPAMFIQTLRAGEGFLAQSSKVVHFGLGRHERVERIVVRWPDGKVEEFAVPEIDCRYRIVQGTGQLEPWQTEPRAVLFASSELNSPAKTERARIVMAARRNMPSLHYETLDGQATSLDAHVEGPVLINLWATWCQPCLKELSEFAEHGDAIRTSGLNILAIDISGLTSTGDSSTADPQKVLDHLKFDFPAVRGNRELLAQLEKVQNLSLAKHQRLVLPTSFLLDADHRLVAVYKGPLEVETLLDDVRLLTADDEQLFQLAAPFAGKWHVRPGED